MTQTRLILAIALALTTLPLNAAGPDRSEFEKWMQQETQSFQEYRDKRDKEFTSFLKTQWKEMQTFQGLKQDETPKPVTIPVAPPTPVVMTTPKPAVTPPPPSVPVAPKPVEQPPAISVPKPPADMPVTHPAPAPQPVISQVPPPPPAERVPALATPAPAPVIPIIAVPEIKPAPAPVVVAPATQPALPKGQMLTVDFYGQALKFSYDPKLNVRMSGRIDEKAMSNHWSALSLADYESLLKQLEAQRQPLQLNDWGFALLVYNVAQGIEPSAKNEQAMLSWFFMTKAGYRARIAFDSSRVYLLMPTQQPVYAASYFTFDNVRYYALSFDGEKQNLGSVYTYDGQYPGASKALDMRLMHAWNTSRKEQDRTLKFSFNKENYQIRAGYDQQTIRYLQTYPQLDINLYFVADVNRATANPLLQQLKPLVQGKSEQDAVNLLLRFVQTSFPYKTDDQQFGTENYLFPEETLFYPYSDCEDRSVFFAWLVRNLTGLEVVGLDYPGHISTAVLFHENVAGDSVNFNGKRYVIADPTYINANAGMAMPEFKNARPKVIAF
jgi:hypothetical protein